MPSLTVVLTNFNEAANLSGALRSVVDLADEIIVVDGGSTDNSVSVAQSYGVTVFVRGNPRQLNLNMNFGFERSHREWILLLATDERVSAALAVRSEALSEEKLTKDMQSSFGIILEGNGLHMADGILTGT